MFAHRRDQHFGRKPHEGRVDRPDQDRRPFDEARHLCVQPVIIGHLETAGGTQFTELFADRLLPRCGVRHNLGVTQPRLIVFKITDREMLGRMEPMARRLVGEFEDAVTRVQATVQARAIEDRQDGVQWPDPAETRFRPAHRLRPGNVIRNGDDDFRQHVTSGPACFLPDRDIEGSLLVFADFAVLERDRN